MGDKAKLKPCQCGESDLHRRWCALGADIYCACGMKTEKFETIEEAAKVWNHRPTAAAPSLLSELLAVEWVEVRGGWECPWCKTLLDELSHAEYEGHAADCQRQAAVKMARGEG